MTPNPAKKQKLERPGRLVVVPRKNAMAFVKLVIVMEEPAFIIAIFILFSIESLGSV